MPLLEPQVCIPECTSANFIYFFCLERSANENTAVYALRMEIQTRLRVPPPSCRHLSCQLTTNAPLVDTALVMRTARRATGDGCSTAGICGICQDDKNVTGSYTIVVRAGTCPAELFPESYSTGVSIVKHQMYVSQDLYS